ncbi:endoglucanase 3 [Phlyctema vagabunda]|uniref:cellulase n=1 Tax=Phlyctema vagabunda TaxID=108571 RepID=A0ABR4PNJ8_9HELO
MRFSTCLLAAGFTASALAAPVAQAAVEDDACGGYEAPSSSSAILASSSTAIASVSSAITSSLTKPVTTSAVAPVATEASSSISSSSFITSAVAEPSTTSAANPVTTQASSTSASPSITTKVAVPSSTASKNGTLQWLGANQSGAEFGQTNIPGVLGTDYTWPTTSAIQTMIDQGMNIFRVPILMERIAQGTMTASLDATYLGDLSTLISFITGAGAHAVIDMHNFGRYDGAVMASTSDFKTFWTNVATEFKSDEKVIFDCNNEFHDMPSMDIVVSLNQACIDGVRASGATSQYIFVEGTSYTGAWTWTTSGNSDSMGTLTDPSDKIVYEMHQYLDADGSGTSSTCVSSTIGAERVAAATEWLQSNGKKGILGEFAGGVNADCESAVTGMLDSLVAANDVWMGALWWGAGPWWGDYIYAMQPPSGAAYVAYMDLLTKYV